MKKIVISESMKTNINNFVSLIFLYELVKIKMQAISNKKYP